jgi:hypothetical protein
MSPNPEVQPSALSPATETAPFEVFCSRRVTGWLADERLSFALKALFDRALAFGALGHPNDADPHGGTAHLPIAVGTDTAQ